MFKTNRFGFGFLLGLFSQGILFILIYLVNMFLKENQSIEGIDISTNILTSIFFNVILIRYYFINQKLEKTGTGILVATFLVTGIAFIVFNLI